MQRCASGRHVLVKSISSGQHYEQDAEADDSSRPQSRSSRPGTVKQSAKSKSNEKQTTLSKKQATSSGPKPISNSQNSSENRASIKIVANTHDSHKNEAIIKTSSNVTKSLISSSEKNHSSTKHSQMLEPCTEMREHSSGVKLKQINTQSSKAELQVKSNKKPQVSIENTKTRK